MQQLTMCSVFCGFSVTTASIPCDVCADLSTIGPDFSSVLMSVNENHKASELVKPKIDSNRVLQKNQG